MTTCATLDWKRVLHPEHSRAAIRIVREVARRMRDPRDVEAAASIALRQTAHPETIHWEAHGVAQGFAGLSLLWGYLDRSFPHEGWDALAHEHLRWAMREAENQPVPAAGAFAGLSGLAFAASYLSRDGVRYPRLLAELDRLLLSQIVDLADMNVSSPGGVSVGYFDIISGLAGIGAYLLCRRERPECALALEKVLRRVIAITGEREDGIPRWFTAPEFLTDESRAEFPDGNLNCGLAHGIPGPLALLSLALLHDVHIDGMIEAVDRAAAWLCRHRADDDWGVNWPYAVPLTMRNGKAGAGDLLVNSESELQPSRAAWCYGSPGIARALWFAGEALGDSKYRELAIHGMEAVLRKPVEYRAIDSATFCHGVAGLLQVVLRFAHDTGLPDFAEGAQKLTAQLLALYEPARLLGYCSLDRDGAEIDNPGLLDGAPGVALVLLAAATDVEPAWDRLFLLS